MVSSLFSAMISFLKYIADPYDQLPAIVFWLMGSLASARYQDIFLAGIPMVAGCSGLLLLSYRINVLSMGDREASSLGVNVTSCPYLRRILHDSRYGGSCLRQLAASTGWG